jgi:hypothetical protein
MILVVRRNISRWVEQFFQHQFLLASRHLLSYFAVISIRYCYIWIPTMKVPSSRWPFFMHNTGGRRQRSWKTIAFGRCNLLYWTFSFIYVVNVNITVIYFTFFFQVRLGTERAAEVVKVTVSMLYALLVAFGLSKTLPLTCIVSTFRKLYASHISVFYFLCKYSCYSRPITYDLIFWLWIWLY